MTKLTKDELIKAIEEMTVLELSELVKALEEKFGVSAAATMTVAAPQAATTTEEPKEEQTIFNVVLEAAGANKITVIKTLRELVPTLSLVEAKGKVDTAPQEIMSQVNKKVAEEARDKLKAAGATVALK